MLLVITLALTSFFQTAFNLDFPENLQQVKLVCQQQAFTPVTNCRMELECSEAGFTITPCTEI